jgi:hypothetical protein
MGGFIEKQPNVGQVNSSLERRKNTRVDVEIQVTLNTRGWNAQHSTLKNEVGTKVYPGGGGRHGCYYLQLLCDVFRLPTSNTVQ